MKPLIALTAVACFAASPVAQGVDQTGGAAGGDIDPGQNTVQADATATLHGYVGVLPMVDPRRIAPGQGGEVVLAMSLMQSGVIDPAGKFGVTYERKQGSLALGDWSRDPATVGKHHQGTKGKAVYDDVVMVRIPVAVATGTAHGEYSVDLKIEAEIKHGETGQIVGVFREATRAKVVVGPPLPNPGVRGLRTPRGAEPDRAATGPSRVSGPAGFALTAARRISIARGATKSFDVILDIPDGAYVNQDADLGVPELSMKALGVGLAFELGPAPSGERKEVAGELVEIHTDRYQRSITLRADSDAAAAVRHGKIVLRYAYCDASACFPPRELELPIEVSILAAGTPSGPAGGADAPQADPSTGSDPLVVGDDGDGSMLLWLLGGFGGLLLLGFALVLLRGRT